jgi:hypothetical protein
MPTASVYTRKLRLAYAEAFRAAGGGIWTGKNVNQAETFGSETRKRRGATTRLRNVTIPSDLYRIPH